MNDQSFEHSIGSLRISGEMGNELGLSRTGTVGGGPSRAENKQKGAGGNMNRKMLKL